MNKAGGMLLAIILAFTAGPALAQEGKPLTFATDPTWPPLEYVDANNQIVGYSIDYFTAVCQESGRTAKFSKTEWDGIFEGLDANKYDVVMSSVTVTPERRQKMDFTIPYYIVRQSLLAPKNSALTNIRQLKGQRAGTQVETTATEIVEKLPGVVSKTFPTIEEAVKAMLNGEIEAVVCEDVVATDFMNQPNFAGRLKIAAIINTPGAEELYAAAVRKNNLEVLVALNDGIKAVKAKGIEAELRRKWFPESGK